jgi:biopolymer transport protein ExbD
MRKRASGASDAGLDMTPMIDMTFQLITFFMFVLNFSKDAADERVRLPIADQATPLEGATEEPLFLNVDRDAKLLAVGQAWDIEADRPAIENYLQRESDLARRNMRFAAPTDSKAADDLQANRLWSTVVIRADKSTPYRGIRGLIEACQKFGYYKFAIRALPEEQL